MVKPARRKSPTPPGVSGQEGNWTATLAKWLVPSVAGLFAIVGYIAQTSQESLLGLPSDDGDSSKYLESSAQFLGDCLLSLLSGATAVFDGGLDLDGNVLLLVCLTLCCAAILSAPRFERRLPPTTSPVVEKVLTPVTIATLLVVILLKLALFDVPLLNLRDIILDAGMVPGQAAADTYPDSEVNRLPPETFAQRVAAGCPKVAEARSVNLEETMRAQSYRLLRVLVQSRIDSDPNVGKQKLLGLFLSQLWMAALIASLSGMVLHRQAGGAPGAVLAILSLAYLLTVPYADGKLMRSTYFDFGRVRLADELKKTESTAPPNGAADRTVDSNQYGLVLNRSQAGVTLLTTSKESCPAGKEGMRVTMSSIAPAQLLSVEEIYRQDVITWTATHSEACLQPAQSPTMQVLKPKNTPLTHCD